MEPTRASLILVVEDSANVRCLIVEILGRAGFRVLSAGTALEAVRLARAQWPDLILADLGLPDQDGGLAMACLKDYPDFEKVPLVLVSGEALEVLRARAQDVGASAFLQKPFKPGALLECVCHWIQASRSAS